MGSREVEWQRMARSAAESIGHEVTLARTNLGLTRNAASLLAGVSPSTQIRVEEGDPRIGLDTACQVSAGVGLKLWAKAFPVRMPSLRDTGQLRIAEILRALAADAYRVTLELGLGNGRSIDVAFFGPVEIIAAEIERLLADFQAQYRAAAAKRDELALLHRRPVRLILVVADNRRNRAVVSQHAELIRMALPAGSREILKAIRHGEPLGRDGMLWVRPSE